MEATSIEGYEGYYSVTSDGRVYRHSQDVARNFYGGKWLKPIRDKDGYLRVHLSVNKCTRKRGIHQLVAEAFVHNPHDKPVVHHKDNDKTNNCAENLEWLTFEENSSRAHAGGMIKVARDSVTGRFLGGES